MHLTLAIAIVVSLAGCSDATVKDKKPDTGAAGSSDQRISPVGRLVDRRVLLQRIVERDGAQLTGTRLTELGDLGVDESLSDGPLSRVLGELLPDQTYRLAVGVNDKGAQVLTHLHIGSASNSATSGLEDSAAFDSEPNDAIDDDRIRALSERFAAEEPADRLNTIDEVELTLGGVKFLGDVINSGASQRVQLAAIGRLDLGEEIGAKQQLLNTLAVPDDALVMAALESVQRWSDPTTLNHVKVLTSHSNNSIRAAAQLLVDDLIAGYGGSSNALRSAPVTVDPRTAREAARENAERFQRLREQRADNR